MLVKFYNIIGSIKAKFKRFCLNNKPLSLGCDGCGAKKFYIRYDGSSQDKAKIKYIFLCSRCGRQRKDD